MIVGLVHPRPDVRAGRILRSLRSARMLPTPALPGRPAGPVRAQHHDRPHPHPLLLRLLRGARARKQVRSGQTVGSKEKSVCSPKNKTIVCSLNLSDKPR